MIEFLSNWAKDICLAVIVISILEMILPNNKSKKYVKMCMGVYLLFTMISPFIKNSDKFNLNELNLDKNILTSSNIEEGELDQSSMDKRLKEIYEEELEKDIKEKLEEKGYSITKCKVEANLENTQTNGGINKIELKVENAKQEEKENKEDVENKIIDQIQKIKTVEIGKSKNELENQEITKITKTDKKEIEKFLIEEYGVNEECLEIN